MKAGKTLQALAAEIERQQNEKKDYVADTRHLRMRANGSVKLELSETGRYPLWENAHGQIAARLKIPKPYYDRMKLEAPKLLANNVNHWFEDNPEKRMVRTLDGNVRAFLSERYRALDNFDLANSVLPVLGDAGLNVDKSSFELTERRMYIKAVTPRFEAEIKKGDPVQAGIVISNSEVGAGSLKVQPLLFRLVCDNGLISNDHSLKKYHVGRSQGGDDNVWEVLTDRTREMSDKAFWHQVQDLTRAALQESLFNEMVKAAKQAADMKIEADPIKVVERTAKSYDLNETEKSGVLRHLIDGGDLSQWGLVNAVTREAQDVDDYDRSTELEKLGGKIVELSPQDWKSLATVA